MTAGYSAQLAAADLVQGRMRMSAARLQMVAVVVAGRALARRAGARSAAVRYAKAREATGVVGRTWRRVAARREMARRQGAALAAAAAARLQACVARVRLRQRLRTVQHMRAASSRCCAWARHVHAQRALASRLSAAAVLMRLAGAAVSRGRLREQLRAGGVLAARLAARAPRGAFVRCYACGCWCLYACGCACGCWCLYA